MAPPKSVFLGSSFFGGPVRFVLGGSGHIAGVVNPPQPPRRNYWTNDLVTDSPDDWFARAASVPGSWWPHWAQWLAGHAGTKHAAPHATGSDLYAPLEPAPGGYVRAPA